MKSLAQNSVNIASTPIDSGATSTGASLSVSKPYARNFALILLALLLIRLIFLFILPYGLHGDEAQYWAWSRDLDWGYFSKPPMIAWVIWATTSIFGNAEWAVRLAAPFLHIATAWMLFLTGRKFFGSQVGFWAGLTYTLMPAVWLSSFIISTDAVLLLCWSTALHGWACLRERPTYFRAFQLGAAIGLGLLSKYAMLYFIPPFILAIIFDPPTRRALMGAKGFIVRLMILALIVPNLIWNINHSFATFSHTVENANIQKDIFHPAELLEFLFAQFGVFGPINFVLFIIALIAACRGKLATPARLLTAFSILPLTLISIEALISRANANWAVTAYATGAILLALWAVGTPRRLRWLKWGLISQLILALFIGASASFPSWVNQLGLTNAAKRLRAWPETTARVEDLYKDKYRRYGFHSITTDNRLVFYNLRFYGIEDTAPLSIWPLNKTPSNHAELTSPLTAGEAPVLIINYNDNYDQYLLDDFGKVTPLPPLEIPVGNGKMRRFEIWIGYGYKPTDREDR